MPQAPPYKAIDLGLRNGLVIPFLGAGASLGCPVIEDTEAAAPPRFATMPSAAQVSTMIAELAEYPSDAPADLATVAQFVQVASGRPLLQIALREIFLPRYQPGRIHRYLASIDRHLLIVTTNYDTLIEDAFEAAGRPYDLVVHTTDAVARERLLWWRHGAEEPEQVLAKKLLIDLDETTVIYKMHGAVDRREDGRDQYVITEDDYVDFLSRLLSQRALPHSFAKPFQSRQFLFLGYGLRDWNVRVVLNRVDRRNIHGKRVPPSWAIEAKPSMLETKLWEHRDVDVYGLTIEEFLDGVGFD